MSSSQDSTSFDYGWTLNGFNASINIDQSMDPAVLQQTRHARRLYVGGIPQNYANEELIIKHFNSIISEGLGEENDSSYVNSVYINHKKCFAFVELKSMELTTACLELDGIVYHNSILKIQRANEYKPELVPGPTRPPLKLKLPSSAYLGTTAVVAPDTREQLEPRIGTLVQQGAMANVERGSIVLLGFPYDEGSRRAGGNVGAASGPKVVRRHLRKVGTIQNPEYDLDLTNLRIIDIGDITVGMAVEEAQTRLSQTVTEIIRRGAFPIVIGGSGDLSYYNASALMSVAGGNTGIVSVDSKLAVRPPNMEGKTHSGTPFRQLLEDTRFCSPRDGLTSMPSCEGKFVAFGAQGTLCSEEQSKYIQSRGGFILWFAKDLRASTVTTSSATTRSGQIFRDALRILGENPNSGGRRPLFVSIRMSAMSSAVCPGVDDCGSMGLNGDEALEICQTCGNDQNVVLLDLTEFNPEVEEARTGKFIAEMIYYFVLGFAARLKAAGTLPTTPPTPLAPPVTYPSQSQQPMRESQSSVSVSSGGMQGNNMHGNSYRNHNASASSYMQTMPSHMADGSMPRHSGNMSMNNAVRNIDMPDMMNRHGGMMPGGRQMSGAYGGGMDVMGGGLGASHYQDNIRGGGYYRPHGSGKEKIDNRIGGGGGSGGMGGSGMAYGGHGYHKPSHGHNPSY